MELKIKICGMKIPENIQQIFELEPEYVGFIFFENSPRFFEEKIPEIQGEIKKVGVFVDADFHYILSKVKEHQLDAIQLHGNESATFCELFKDKIEIIKAFSIDENFDFNVILKYEAVCDFFLFDTKGKYHGGNGNIFNWNILEKYKSYKPYFLSGGIGIDELKSLKTFLSSEIGKKCFAIDVNSKFEIEPGLKNVQLLKQFKDEISS